MTGPAPDTKSQEAAFRKLSRLKCGALFMEMGTGKTKVALDLMASRSKRCRYYLWICPFSTKGAIEEELRKWHPELPVDIVGVETLSQSDREFLRILRAMQRGRAFVTVDESLKIKNREAKRTERVMRLGRMAEWRLVLNGTPLSKNVLDLWTQMQFLSPKILRMDYADFKDAFTEYYVRGRLRGLVRRQANIPALVAKIAPYVFDAELDLGLGKSYEDIPYPLYDPEGYAALKEELVLNGTSFDFMATCQSLQRFYCGSPERRRILGDLIDRLDGQAVVFAKFLDTVPDGVLRITGETKGREREEAVRAFREGKAKALWMTYGCGAFGLNLQNAKHAVFADHTFDYAQRVQAEARIYRLGQAEAVAYHSLWCDCGLERLIRASLDKKTGLLAEVKAEIERKGRKEWLKSL